MKNKYEKLYSIMELLKDEFIEEAFEEEKVKTVTLWKFAVAACICILACSSWFSLKYIYPGNTTEIKHQEEADDGNYKVSTNIDRLPEIKYEKSTENLEKIICSFQTDGRGAGGNYGTFIIKSIKDKTSKNPTRNNTEGITELPVFKNEPGLWSDTIRMKDFNKSTNGVYFAHLSYETQKTYPYDGSSPDIWNICFQSDKSEDITTQLLQYTFYRSFYTGSKRLGEGKKGWYKVMVPPSGTGKIYPLISQEQAEQKLRKGEFFTVNPYDKDVAETAQVLSVELEYRTDEYQVYIQPFYKFIITDDSWDISEVMRCENWEDYMSVSEVYVPAVQDQYLDIIESAELRVN